MDKIIINKLDEIIYHEQLDNGLNVYIYKKKGFNKKTANFVTKYGSYNYEFMPINKDEIKTFPHGIAHFLEHKLFEYSDNENIFSKYEKYGAGVNAFTNYNETCYYFVCSENFNECLNLLLDFVQSPFFTDENVEKEKGIIKREIDMWDDNVNEAIYQRQMENVLFKNPRKYSITGDKKDIDMITKDDLYECYNTFYNPSNMILTISGDVDVRKTLDIIKKNQKSKKFDELKDLNLPSYNEKKEVVRDYEHIIKNVASPRINICYKILVPRLTKKELFKQKLFLSLFFEMKFGSATGFKKKLMNDKIIKSIFGANFYCFDDVILMTFNADVIDKEKFIDEVDKKLKEYSFDEKLFELVKKAYLASMVRAFDSPSSIANKIYEDIVHIGEFTSYAYEEYENFKFDEFKDMLKILDFNNKSVIYVTNSKEE